MKNPVLILLLILFVGCKRQNQTLDDAYIISREDSLQKVKLTRRNSPPVFPGFYSTFNIVLDTSGKIFLHRKSIMSMCSTDADPSKPDFLDLRPSDFFIIRGNNLNDLVKDNVLNNEVNEGHNRQFIYIASPVDTIRQKEFYQLFEYLRDERLARFVIRRTTEEEDAVIKAVKENSPYYSSEVKWKVGFSNVGTDSLYSIPLIYN